MNSFLESQARCFEGMVAPLLYLTRTTPGELIARLLSHSRWSRVFDLINSNVREVLAVSKVAATEEKSRFPVLSHSLPFRIRHVLYFLATYWPVES